MCDLGAQPKPISAEDYSRGLRDVIYGMLKKLPQERLTATTLLSHTYINAYIAEKLRKPQVDPQATPTATCDELGQTNMRLAAEKFYTTATESSNPETQRDYLLKAMELYHKLGIENDFRADACRKLGQMCEAEEERQKYQEEAKALYTKLANASIASAYCSKGNTLEDAKEQQTYYKRAIEHYEKCQIENPDTALAYINLGTTYTDKLEQRKCYAQALEIFEKLQVANANTALAHFNMGTTYDNKNDKKISYERAITIYENLKVVNAHVASAYHNMGAVCDEESQKRYYYKKAVDAYDLLHLDSPNSATAFYSMATVASDFKAKRYYYERAIALYEKLNLRNASAAKAYYGLGVLLGAQGLNSEATACGQRARKIYTALYGKTHPKTLDVIKTFNATEGEQDV